MRMLKYDLDRKSLKKFYTSFIRPTLEYGNIIWDNCTKQQANLLESIQLDAARIITILRKGTSHATLLRILDSVHFLKGEKKKRETYPILQNIK